MLKALLTKVHRFMSVQRENPELLIAQYKVFSGQLPLMYLILLTNTWILAAPFIAVAPAWLSLYIPLLFTLVCGVRLIGWWRLRHNVPTAKIAYHALVRSNRLAGVITIGFTAWSLSLYPYGDYLLHSNIAFFMAITGIGVIFCLMNLRSAAFITAIIINISFILFFGLLGIPSFAAMAVNMLLASISLLMVLQVQYRNFTGAVDAQTKLAIMNDENFRLSNMDSITKLPNRRQFFSHLNKSFSEATAEGKRLAVGIIDLDGFKPVNDLYGHSVGDSLLIEVGQRLSALANESTQVSRLGGDEFALVVADCPDDSTLLEQVEEICIALRTPFVLPEATVQISGSAGLSIFPECADNATDLYERADYALYQGKRIQRGQAVLFSTEHINEIQHHSKIEQQLHNANLDHELTVYFQPIVNVKTSKVTAFEALARWPSPVLGTVPPSVFIPIAERAGLINQLTRILLEKALMSALSWPKDIRLSFNLSTHDIRSSESVMRIVSIIRSSGFDPKRIDLEITETAMMYDFVQTRAAIDTLQALGCGIALDDFGTGFSNLSQLHALPLTKIKIDRSFVANLDKKPASYKIVKSLLSLAHDMGIGCVVEGAETIEEIDVLCGLGGQLIQGYFYSAPMPEAKVTPFLASSAQLPSPQQAL